MPYQVLQQLESPDARDRIAAIEALFARDDGEIAARFAARLLSDRDAGVREVAARVLASLGNPEAAAQLAGLIASDDIAVRNLAGEVLVQLGPPAVAALAPAVDDPDPDLNVELARRAFELAEQDMQNLVGGASTSFKDGSQPVQLSLWSWLSNCENISNAMSSTSTCCCYFIP